MNSVILRSNAVGGLLLLITTGSLAVSLGPVRGTALVGRTLDLSVLARLDAGDDAAAFCTDAEVMYSDTRLDAGKVTVRTSSTGEAGQALIRVTSSVIVDEPVVSLMLRAGCSAKNSRRYVLLADLPGQAAERTLPLIPPAPVAAVVPAPAGSSQTIAPGSDISASRASSVAGTTPSEASTAVRVPRRERGTPVATAQGVSRNVPNSQPAVGASLSQSLRLGESAVRQPGTPRLRLDSAELLVEGSPSLKSSQELQSLPAESNPRRSEFAALWRALNLRPDEVARNEQQFAELQTQARGLRDASSKNQAELALTRERLKQAEVGRYANPLVYSLVALLVSLLLGAGYFYHRFRNSRARAVWWQQRDAEPAERQRPVMDADLRSQASRLPHSIGPIVMPEPQARTVSREEESFAPVFKAAESTFPPSGISAHGRGVNVNELFDIAQQADFFVSLGQHDHAIEVLSNHIRENAQTSPLAYLDLFKLYHDMDRQPQYDELRLQFNRIFNAEVPPFQGFRQLGDGLEAYEGAMTRIQSLWNTPRVLDVIEESLFRKPGRPAEAFGLEAYRELLLLYAIANEFIDFPRQPDFDQTDVPGPVNDGSTPAIRRETASVLPLTELQALNALAGHWAGDDEPPVVVQNSVGASSVARLGLDIDLTDSWLGVDSPEPDRTVVLASLNSGAFQPPSSAWLDFDLSDISPAVVDDGSTPGAIKRRDDSPRN